MGWPNIKYCYKLQAYLYYSIERIRCQKYDKNLMSICGIRNIIRESKLFIWEEWRESMMNVFREHFFLLWSDPCTFNTKPYIYFLLLQVSYLFHDLYIVFFCLFKSVLTLGLYIYLYLLINKKRNIIILYISAIFLTFYNFLHH